MPPPNCYTDANVVHVLSTGDNIGIVVAGDTNFLGLKAAIKTIFKGQAIMKGGISIGISTRTINKDEFLTRDDVISNYG